MYAERTKRETNKNELSFFENKEKKLKNDHLSNKGQGIGRLAALFERFVANISLCLVTSYKLTFSNSQHNFSFIKENHSLSLFFQILPENGENFRVFISIMVTPENMLNNFY